MSKQQPTTRNEERRPSHERRPYEKPGFLTHEVFERQSLSCSGTISQNPGPPPFGCSLRS
jgi:hypothetical protein